MSKTARGVLAAVSMMAAGMSVADTGFYIGGGYGIANTDGTANTDGSPVLSLANEIEELPLDGAPFDDDDGTWNGFLGYEANAYVSLEAGYTDFGSFTSDAGGFNGAEAPSLDIDGIYLMARLRYPLRKTISATWHAGLVEASFDVDGQARIAQLGSIFGPIEFLEVPFSDVDDETGYRWGFGIDWRFAERASAGLEFSRQQLKVLDVDTFNLRLTAHL